MKIKKRKDQTRELVVLGAIMHDVQVLHSVVMWYSQYQEDLFLGKHHQRLTDWCIEHYQAKKQIPTSKILFARYYEPWEEEIGKGDEADAVAQLIQRVDAVWKDCSFARDQLFDIAEDVLRRQQVLIASDRCGGSSSARLISDIVPGAVAVTLAREPEYDNFFDDPNIATNVAESTKPIFTFENEVVTDFFEDTFAPATFSTFLAPEKRGKSQWLLECVMSALKCKKNVLYFDAGDMTEEQIFMRFAARMLERPYKPGDQWVFNGDLDVDGEALLFEAEEVHHDNGLTQDEFNSIKRKCAKRFAGRLFTRNFARGTLEVSTMRTIMDNLSLRGVKIDVLIVDYADILRPSKSKYSDNRHAITEIWGDLRTLSSTYKLALITATQSDAESYENELHQGSFSESKTKNAFITAEIGIDKTAHHESIFKLKYVFRRTGSLSKAIFVASDLATYRPAMKAIWVPKDKKQNRKDVRVKFSKKKGE